MTAQHHSDAGPGAECVEQRQDALTRNSEHVLDAGRAYGLGKRVGASQLYGGVLANQWFLE
ncbi:MAG TPA: hypothetical protein VMT37_01555 [Solirubrobacterales bacterium]|nr:hypothetical protein [Solirubrobacterales bacterium]